jgi:hypothetical protein
VLAGYLLHDQSRPLTGSSSWNVRLVAHTILTGGILSRLPSLKDQIPLIQIEKFAQSVIYRDPQYDRSGETDHNTPENG